MKRFVRYPGIARLQLAWMLVLCLGCFFWIAGCNPRGIPASRLLTPAGLEPNAALITPSVTSTPVAPEPQPESATPLALDLPTTEATPIPQPTASATISATPGKTATKTRYPTKTFPPTRTRRPSRTPTISLTPTPPWAFIRIARPGPLSKVGSPINVEMGMTPGEDGKLYIDLVGEDGRYITRLTKDFRQYINKQIYTAVEIPFDIPGVAETSRVVMSARDRLGRTIALSSLDLVLIKLGDSIITNPGFQQEPFIIRNHKPDATVQGGILHLEGVGRPINSQPVIFELINEDGTVLETNILQIEPPSGPLSHTPFTLDIPYNINAPSRVLLTMRQVSDGRIPGTIALSSLPLRLEP